MNKKEYEKMASFENNYWWHKGKVHLVTTLLDILFPSAKDLEILEIGCGTGGVTKVLSKYGNVMGIDMSEDAVEISRESGIKNVHQADFMEMDLESMQGRFDLVLALDVLEHIQDDVEAMKRVKSILKKDGYFFINVPSFKFLWSEHDEALHHKRRYHSYELTRKLEDVGYEIVKNTFFVTFVFPVIVFYRFIGNIFGRTVYPKTSYVILPKFYNDLLTKLLEFEAKIVTKARLPVGATLTVIARPNNGQ